jgi:hypothetical protein
MATVNSPFSGLVYKQGYIAFDGNVNDQVESFDIDVTDGGEDVKTLMRGYAGRIAGAAMTTMNFSGAIPAATPDVGGAGFNSLGMVTGKGVPLDQTLLTNYNANNYSQVQMIMFLGPQTSYTQQLVFLGNITTMKYTAGVGKPITFSGTATGSFSVWQS